MVMKKREINMSTFIGIVALLGFTFVALQYGMKIDVIGWIKKKIGK